MNCKTQGKNSIISRSSVSPSGVNGTGFSVVIDYILITRATGFPGPLCLLGENEENGPGSVIECCFLQEFVAIEKSFCRVCPPGVGHYESFEGIVLQGCVFCGHS